MKKKKQASEEYTGLRCPKCRAPVPAGAGRCTRCNTLLDPDTGQARTRLTDVDMLELVEASRRARTKGLAKTAAGILIMLVALMLLGDTEGSFLYSVGVIIIVIGGGVLCTGLITLKEYKGHIKEQLSRSVVPQVLSEVFDQVEYDAYRHISPEVIYASGAFPFGFDKASGGDYIKASYRGVGLELCDLGALRPDAGGGGSGDHHRQRREQHQRHQQQDRVRGPVAHLGFPQGTFRRPGCF